MTSEIRVNKLTNRIGLSTVTFADSGIGVTVTGRIDPDTDSARDLGTTSVRWRNAYVDTYYGDGSNLTGLNSDLVNDTSPQLGGDLASNSHDILFADNDKAIFGTGSDFKIYHNGTDNYIMASNGHIRFDTGSAELARITSTGKLLVGTQTEGHGNADELTISFNNTGVSGGDQGRCGMTIRSGDNTSGVTQNGYIYFSDGTSGGNEYKGVVAYSHSDDSMYFSTNETERLRINSSGQMGLGTNNPSNLLHIKDTSNSAMMRLESSSYSSYIAQIQSNNNVGNGSEAGNLYLRGQSGVQMSGNGGTATQFDLDGTSLSITGTTDGVLNLDTSDSRGSFIRFKQGGSSVAFVGCGNGLGLGNTNTLALRSNADIRIRVGTEEHATFTTPGYLAVKGEAGNWIYGNHPSNYNFHQFSSSKNGDWMMQFRQEHFNGLGFNMRVNNNNSNEAIALYRESQGNYGFKVYNSGNVQNINNSYGSLSDVSLKENIVDAKSQWNDIKGIKVRNFNLKSDDDKVKMLGVVAQELESVSPKLVFEDKDGVKGVHYSVLYMKAIKALQEAQERIEKLEQDNIELRARVTNLEGN